MQAKLVTTVQANMLSMAASEGCCCCLIKPWLFVRHVFICFPAIPFADLQS